MENAIITGSTGAVGIALIKRLIQENIKVTAVCHKGSARIHDIPANPLVHIVECDLDEIGNLPEGLAGKDYTGAVFYHFGWDGTFGNTRNNVEGQSKNIQYTIAAAAAAHKIGCGRFIGAGSQAEYGRPDVSHYPRLTPDTPVRPENSYGAAKLCAGSLSRMKCEQLGLEHIWVRILSVYGPYDGKNTMVSFMLGKLLKGEHVSCTAGGQIWDYLYAEDAAEAFYLLGKAGKKAVDGKTYVLGSGEARPLREYMYLMRDIVSPGAELGLGEVPYADKQVMHLAADISRLTEDTGFTPMVSFEEGIRRTADWMREVSG